MKAFRTKTSIRKKLINVLLLTSCGALLLSSLGFAVNDWLSLRSAMFDHMHGQSSIIANNSIAAMAFNDAESAKETLNTLQNDADIVGAALYLNNKTLFAHYERDSNRIPDKLPDLNTGSLNGDQFVVEIILHDNEPLGYIMLISDYSNLKKRQFNHLLIAFGVFSLALLFSLLLSRRLQRIISEPILKLAETARTVSENQDYELRAKKLSTDEIGALVDDFNNMLSQIQLRDHKLLKARNELENKVRVRTQELTELTRQLEHQAYHDTLTGLSNRVTFDDHLQLAIKQARRHKQKLAVLFLDLDRFKIINDTLGHGIGDKLLIRVAKRLSACLRESDTLARLGGDEFAVLLPQIHQASEAAEVAKKITTVIAETIMVEGYSLHVTTSLGISLFPDDGEESEVIVKNADTAMYRSKDQGRNQFTFFSAEMNARAERRLMLETKLRKALKENHLSVNYQPRRNTETLEIISVEALARWNDPEEGAITPGEFIPLAEECGLIAKIDEWVLETACQDMLSGKNGLTAQISLAVNLSPAQFIRKDLHEVIASILQRTGFPGSRLELEITESLFSTDSNDVCATLEQLRALGIELSIDDFGTAYSSLSRLKQLPLNTLKIDQSFMRDLGKDPDDEALVRTIITMAHNLNLKVVAEGVETELQYQFVKQHGCDIVQGYLFGKPVSFTQIQQLLS
ncbi:MAG: EAL domain-containing protein [Methyloprofundus sp.]|nr:EAL domain-containing protein [Methyloprofundus sp.]